jgi:hypothetical protein
MLWPGTGEWLVGLRGMSEPTSSRHGHRRLARAAGMRVARRQHVSSRERLDSFGRRKPLKTTGATGSVGAAATSLFEPGWVVQCGGARIVRSLHYATKPEVLARWRRKRGAAENNERFGPTLRGTARCLHINQRNPPGVAWSPSVGRRRRGHPSGSGPGAALPAIFGIS